MRENLSVVIRVLIVGAMLRFACAATGQVAWFDDALPGGAGTGADGGDSWNWVSSNPAPYSGTLAHQSNLAPGEHEHYFNYAWQTLAVASGDILFTYVYLDPSNPPSEIMLEWNDGASWEHRAYWGADILNYGTDGTPGQQSMGPLPAAGQWVQLQVPASAVGLEGGTVSGMGFTLYDGRATWDYTGKTPAPAASNPGANSQTNSASTTPSVPTNAIPALVLTNAAPTPSVIDDVALALAKPGDTCLHILSPTFLEVCLINTKQPDPAAVTNWNLVDASGNFQAPAPAKFTVLVDQTPVAVRAVGFRRRPSYAPNAAYDLRLENCLCLELATPVNDNQTVQVLNPPGDLWPSSTQFSASAHPLRYSPAIHVNQEGYVPGFSKTAMVGYYLGNLGEMPVPFASGFQIVDATTGAVVFQGPLASRLDAGFPIGPAPYQQVYQADFSALTTPGRYQLLVPGLGASLPFRIDEGVAMAFTRAYALGIYHQRCGTNNALPFTRFVHDPCHTAPASVPSPAANFAFTWTTVSNYAATINPNNPPQTAPLLTSESAQLFPFVNKGAIDVSGGHHDAGDYSKYTINVASLVHELMFAVDSLPGVAALDNLGIPESGDGISDVMQEAKWEADFLAKMQDADGGFYFLVYPENREYESNVLPDHGDAQVVWPKNTSVTAAAVAALAQCASSPRFKAQYPAAAALYMRKAQLGWNFLTNAIATYGKTGAYQKITFYGDDFADQDELAWAACQMFLATGDPSLQQLLLSWFDPSSPATWRWGWWHMAECYGNAIRSFAFAAQSGRIAASQLDPAFLAKCQAEIAQAGNDALTWSGQSAYGTSFPAPTKAVLSAGWYFSVDQAYDMIVAYQLNPLPAYLDALVANINYEGGCNPVNVTYDTGLGWKRQREIVDQYAQNDRRVLPPSGIPLGNLQTGFTFLWYYGMELSELCFPSDAGSSAPYAPYDRWADGFNVTTEFVGLNQARGLAATAFLSTLTSLSNQAWTAVAAQIQAPTNTALLNTPITVSLQAPGLDLTGARIVWEAQDQQPAFGQTFTFSPVNSGVQWVEAEAQFPDGRRVFAAASFYADSTNVAWVNGALPAGASPDADGGDGWNWTAGSPAPVIAPLDHQSTIGTGEHEHYFTGATATMFVPAGSTLYAWVYLDPANPPTEVELMWNDGTSWEHRAYWGADSISFGADGTTGRFYAGPLPPPGQWVCLQVPASAVGLDGGTLNGMSFALFGGSASWDAAGRTCPPSAIGASAPAPSAPTVAITQPVNNSVVSGSVPVSASASSATTIVGVQFAVDGVSIGSAVPNAPFNSKLDTTKLASGQHTLAATAWDSLGHQATSTATVTVLGKKTALSSVRPDATGGMIITWRSQPGQIYQVAYKADLAGAWIYFNRTITASGSTTSWLDDSASAASQRFYAVFLTD